MTIVRDLYFTTTASILPDVVCVFRLVKCVQSGPHDSSSRRAAIARSRQARVTQSCLTSVFRRQCFLMEGIFRIHGNKKLSGSVEISGSKNAALPILAASVALQGTSKITNLPNISDIGRMLDMIESIGGKVERNRDKASIDADSIALQEFHFDHFGIGKMRASILFLAPLLVRFGEVRMKFPGGCVLGKRSADAHLRAFEALGAEVIESQEYLHLNLPSGKFEAGKIVLPEISVTATENAIIAASFAEGETCIRMAASEPHVQNLCHFLVSAGVQIDGIGTHFLTIRGNSQAKDGQIAVTPDYLEAGTFILAGILTDSTITVKNVVPDHLDSFFEKLAEAGANFEADENMNEVRIVPRKSDLTATNIQTGVFPKFPTDLHPQFGVLMTQCMGSSKIFEVLFERKFAYLLELEKLGADVQILNPHEFLIHGPKKLVAVPVASQDIRAGAAILLATLIAEGESEISNIHYLDRGYQNIEEKLRALGADIIRENR